MTRRRIRVYVLMFLLAAINYIDRSALSVAAAPLAQEFGLIRAASLIDPCAAVDGFHPSYAIRTVGWVQPIGG